jgi:hypothetical protein
MIFAFFTSAFVTVATGCLRVQLNGNENILVASLFGAVAA